MSYAAGAYSLGIVRVSTNATVQQSIPAQTTMIEKQSARLGLPVRQVLKDEMSRSLWPRPGIAEALAMTADPLCVAVIVWEGPRVWGSPTQQAEIFETLEDSGTALYDASGAWLNEPGEVNEFRQGIDSLLSRLEVRRVSRRVHETHKERAERGEFISRPPFGFAKSQATGRVEPVEEQLTALRLAFAWIADEGLSVYAVTERLNAMGATPQAGGQWKNANLSRVLQNRFYVGEMIWNRSKTVKRGNRKTQVARPEAEWVRSESPFGAVIDPELFERAQRRMSETANLKGKRVPNSTGSSNRPYSTLIRCGRCGQRMYVNHETESTRKHSRTGKPVRRAERFTYYCKKRPAACTVAHTISERAITRALEAWLTGKPLAYGTVVNVRLEDSADTSTERQAIKGQIGTLTENRKRAIGLVIKGLITEEDLSAQLAEIDRDLLAAETLLTELEARSTVAYETERSEDARALLGSVTADLFNGAIPVERRQAILSTVVARIDVDSPAVTFVLRERG